VRNIRSSSVRGVLGAFFAELVGRAVQDDTVSSTERYWAVSSAVSAGARGGVAVANARKNGFWMTPSAADKGKSRSGSPPGPAS
jgi:hypothetical protein